MKSFAFHSPGKVVFGKGAVKKRLAAELAMLGVKRPLLVTDVTLADSEMVARVKEALGPEIRGVFTEVKPDTGVDIIDRAAEMALTRGADSVVSVGGGSSIDTAKAVAAVRGENAPSVREVVGFYKLKRPPLPHAAIPTTAGTGSECTSMAVIKDEAAHKKVLLVDQKIIPSLGVLDPTLTTGLPPAITAATGMDALTHAAEAIMSTNAMPPADGLALHAIDLIREHLPRAVSQGDDLEARSAMLVAAAEAGMAFQNAFVGVVHALAHALGGVAGVPHGLANAIMLWVGMEYNAPAAAARVALIGQAMGVKDTGDDMADAAAAVQAMREFTRTIGIPERLSEVGVKAEQLDQCVDLAMADAAIFSNPRQPQEPAELLKLYQKCL